MPTNRTQALCSKILPLLVGAALAGPATAHAAVYFTLQQQGADVVLSLQTGGSLNLTGISFTNAGTQADAGLLWNASTQVALGVGSAAGSDIYNAPAVTGPANFGTGPSSFLPASSNSGTFFGFAYGSGFNQLALPTGYQSGATLGAATATFANTTLAALGVVAGNYTWTLTANNDTINLTVGGGGGSSVPETGSLLVPGIALSAIGLIQWRRRARRS